VIGPQVRNLDQVHVGDRIVLSYYTGIAAEVTRTGSGVDAPDASAVELTYTEAVAVDVTPAPY
jgi:hypothetical protein